MATTSDYREHSLSLHEAPGNGRPLTPFEASIEVREENLIAQARRTLGADMVPSDPSVDMMIARSVHSVAARLRRLKANDSVGRVIDRTKPVPGVKGGPSSPQLELDGISPIQTTIDSKSMVDSFVLVVPQYGTTQKEALTIQKQLADATTGGKKTTMGALDVIVKGGKYGVSSEVTIVSTEGQGAYQRRLNYAYSRYMEYSHQEPWLKAYRLTMSDARDISLQMRPNNGPEVMQALNACDERDRIEKLQKIHEEFARQKKWDHSDEKARFMTLGVLLEAKSILGVR